MNRFFGGYLLALILICTGAHAQTHVAITVDGNSDQKPISPYIFGKNNNLSDSKSAPLSSAQWQRMRDLGIHMFRENGGNNATKYNWRLKLSSHPDWYNNVYAHDWDFAAQSLGTNIPSAQGLWAFQLIGKAAKTTANNFNDWGYNHSQWWSGVGQNLAGGGQMDTTPGATKAKVDGNINLYLENWNPDSTTGILDHWFGPSGIGLDSTKIRYWSMDNEPEIWEGTHDDVYPVQPTAEDFVQKYFAVAKMARAKFPGIKLLGPVPANEWQWYNYPGGKISYKGNSYVWLEYFILRCAEEEQLTGIRLLDVLDLHCYPGETSAADIVQLHRLFFDQTYNYPGANGVKALGLTGWDNSITKEYIFKRCNDWLTQYMGPNHGVKLSVSELGVNVVNPTVTAVSYASFLGEFAKQGVHMFTPWGWNTGMDEVIHLFSRYSKPFYIDAASTDEYSVSAYPTISADKDSLIIFLVNRNLTESRTADINLNGFPVTNGQYKTYRLSNLPATESFVSHTTNALVQATIQVTDNMPSLVLPPLSITAIVLTRQTFTQTQYGYLAASAEAENGTLTGVNVATANPGYSGTGYVTGFDNTGDMVTVSMNVPETGLYKLVIRYNGNSGDKYQNLLVNNVPVATISFPATSGYGSVEAGSYQLNKGNNSFSISKNWGWTDIDKFELYPVSGHVYDITTKLIDSLANDTTKALYNFLLNQFGQRIISGQTDDYYDQLKSVAGYSPMIRNGDLQHYSQGYSYLWKNGGFSFGIDDNGSVEALINWYKNTGGKGIVALQWHWHAPSDDTAGVNTFYTEHTNFDITKAVIPGTHEDSLIIRDIDDISVQLKKFQDAGVPVLWRPLHEAGGGWFWWGAKGPAACLQLYNIMYDRLTNYHQLHNLIWVWSTPETAWYPGNDKVDIIGYDSYPGDFNYGNQKSSFDVLYNLTGGKKLITMSENGPIPDINASLTGDAPWSYFMSWSNLVTQQNSTAHIQEVFANSSVLKLESTNAKTDKSWRSALYPEDWKPGFKDSQGRFLHDFSYAGYHKGEKEIPNSTANLLNITLPPYNADNTGATDVTSIIQQALDDAGMADGGIVYLPAGTYKINAADSSSFALRMSYDSVVLRGAGTDSTFLFNTQTNMRNKDIILVTGQAGNWFDLSATTTNISKDLTDPTRIIPVISVNGFHVGDLVVITSTPTAAFIDEHSMTGQWNADAFKGVAFLRKIEVIDSVSNFLIIDAPTRYYLKTRDQARVYLAKKQLTESGIENLSIGNIENPNSGWADNDYLNPGSGAYEVHASNVLEFRNSFNCWLRNVHSYKPSDNSNAVQLLSNGVRLNQSCNITIDSCSFQAPQYTGDGENGSLYSLESNDCLIEYSKANHGRHNFSFRFPYSNGNVILGCESDSSLYGSNFDKFLSMANLVDACTLNGDYFDAVYSPESDSAIHGFTSTQSVFYNTTGQSYAAGKTYIIDSRQFGNGYIIGTAGLAFNTVVEPVEGIINNYYFNSRPTDFTEGIANGNNLVPASLYLDQLDKRKKDPSGVLYHKVHFIVKDKLSNKVLPNSSVSLYGVTETTDSAGMAYFSFVLEVFSVSASRPLYDSLNIPQFSIHSDTSLYLYLTPKSFKVTFNIVNNITQKPLSSANINFFNSSQITSLSGLATFNITGDSLNYLITRSYYQDASGMLRIVSDTTIILNLIQIQADMKFRLKEGIVPVNNANVRIDNDSLLSNSLGIVTFRQFSVPSGYHYVITKPGYLVKSDDLYLVTDTIIDIPMERALRITENTADESPRLWPSPVTDILNISMKVVNGQNTIRIADILGNVVYTNKMNGNEIHIDLGEFHSGVYLVQIVTNGTQITRKIIKK